MEQLRFIRTARLLKRKSLFPQQSKTLLINFSEVVGVFLPAHFIKPFVVHYLHFTVFAAIWCPVVLTKYIFF